MKIQLQFMQLNGKVYLSSEMNYCSWVYLQVHVHCTTYPHTHYVYYCSCLLPAVIVQLQLMQLVTLQTCVGNPLSRTWNNNKYFCGPIWLRTHILWLKLLGKASACHMQRINSKRDEGKVSIMTMLADRNGVKCGASSYDSKKWGIIYLLLFHDLTSSLYFFPDGGSF